MVIVSNTINLRRSISVRGIFIDKGTVGKVDYSSLNQVLEKCTFYDTIDSDLLLKKYSNFEVLITNKVKFSEVMLKAFYNLKLICLTATGTDNIDLEAAEKLKIAVYNVPGYSTNSVAQHTFTLLLGLTQSLCSYHNTVQAGEWQKRTTFNMLDFPIHELAHKTLGIIGYGNIGRQVGIIAKAFHMKVILANIPGRPPKKGRLPLNELLKKVDYLSLHCALTKSTHNLIGAQELRLMKRTAFLINTTRGNVVNELALANALKKGVIAGAGLDVLSQEPPSRGHPLLNLCHPHLLITPHVAWASAEARQRCIDITANNIRCFTENSQLNRIV